MPPSPPPPRPPPPQPPSPPPPSPPPPTPPPPSPPPPTPPPPSPPPPEPPSPPPPEPEDPPPETCQDSCFSGLYAGCYNNAAHGTGTCCAAYTASMSGGCTTGSAAPSAETVTTDENLRLCKEICLSAPVCRDKCWTTVADADEISTAYAGCYADTSLPKLTFKSIAYSCCDMESYCTAFGSPNDLAEQIGCKGQCDSPKA